ncbi:hypothetical protein [Myceligenerans crystallogenes]|uniref:P-loop NTPase n=1 Tax=Myceligenerans crystallogenes TaxID=316335 RepID=A0ABP4ZGB0_9MICO
MNGPELLTILCAVLGPAETDAVRRLEAPGSGTTVTRRCADLVELLASAEAGAGRVAVVSATLPGLGREAVARLNQAGVRVVALDDAPEPSTERLRAIGVTGVARSVDALVSLVRDETAGAPATAHEPAAPAAGVPGDKGAGRIVTVWGPTGAPGRTTTAIELAVALAAGPRDARRPARRGRGPRRGTGRARGPGAVHGGAAAQALLADADTYGPSVASRLGILDESAGLGGAVRAAALGPLDVATLARHAPEVMSGVRVLTGLARANRWAELPAAALDAVWERSRDLADWTVVDTGPVLETDEMLSYDTRAPQRNAATLGALAAADVVVVVGSGDPIGLHRLMRGLDELAAVPAAVTAHRIVVVNRVRASAVGPQPRVTIRNTLTRFAGVDPHLVPDDPASLDAGLLSGRSLAECAPGSPARAAFAELADKVRRAAGLRALADADAWVSAPGAVVPLGPIGPHDPGPAGPPAVIAGSP